MCIHTCPSASYVPCTYLEREKKVLLEFYSDIHKVKKRMKSAFLLRINKHRICLSLRALPLFPDYQNFPISDLF